MYEYRDGKDLKGYVILKHFEGEGYKKSHIIDIHADDKDTLNELISEAETFAQGTDELNLWTNINNPYKEEFKKRGFFERDSNDFVIIHYNYGKKKILEQGNWWFCLGDNDVY